MRYLPYPSPRRSNGIRSPFAEHSTSVANRRARVSSRFASMTQKMLVRRYEGACNWKNPPGLALASKLALEERIERLRLRLVRVPPGAPLLPRRESRPPGRPHPPRGVERGRLSDVHRAPDALRLARAEPHAEAVGVHAPTHPVDPAEAERLIQRLRVGEAPLLGLRLVATHHQLARRLVMRGEPCSKRPWRREAAGGQA
jgi:hypothetical protein